MVWLVTGGYCILARAQGAHRNRAQGSRKSKGSWAEANRDGQDRGAGDMRIGEGGPANRPVAGGKETGGVREHSGSSYALDLSLEGKGRVRERNAADCEIFAETICCIAKCDQAASQLRRAGNYCPAD